MAQNLKTPRARHVRKSIVATHHHLKVSKLHLKMSQRWFLLICMQGNQDARQYFQQDGDFSQKYTFERSLHGILLH